MNTARAAETRPEDNAPDSLWEIETAAGTIQDHLKAIKTQAEQLMAGFDDAADAEHAGIVICALARVALETSEALERRTILLRSASCSDNS